MKKNILTAVVVLLFSFSSIAGNSLTSLDNVSLGGKYSSTFFNLIKKGNIDAVKSMIESKSAKINRVVDGKTALIVAIENNKMEIFNLLIKEGAKLNKKAKGGVTALMYCAKYGKVEYLKILLANGAKIKTRSTNGYRAIDYAKLSKSIECKKLLG